MICLFGTGRCGSNLLARVLGSHRDIVMFPSEGNELWHPNSYPYFRATIVTPTYFEDPRRFTELSIQSWPQGHVDHIVNAIAGFRSLRSTRTYLLIHSAMISFMIPKIKELFPGTKFIHLYRNGVSVVESFLRKEKEKYATTFPDPDEYRIHRARYWNASMLEVDRLRLDCFRADPGGLLEVSYEEFCREPQSLLKRLSDFLGIDPSGYAYDLSQVESTNYKIQDYRSSQWAPLHRHMEEGMKMKGYLPGDAPLGISE